MKAKKPYRLRKTAKERNAVGAHAPQTQRELDSIPESIPGELKALGVPLIPPVLINPGDEFKPPKKKRDTDPCEKELFFRGSLGSKKAIRTDHPVGETVEEFLARGGQIRRVEPCGVNLGDVEAISEVKLGTRSYRGR